MNHEDWLQRWREGRTGWHQAQVTPLLVQHWDALSVEEGACVLVPLCGKTLDMAWLAERGWRVLGVEISRLAIEQFYDEQGLQPTRRQGPDGTRYAAGSIEIIHGDVFDVKPQTLAGCDAVLDRAALIALAPTARQRYAAQVYGHLPAGCHGLLIALEYRQAVMQGPPFSVAEPEVHALFGADWTLERLEHRASGGPGNGNIAFHAAVYHLRRRLPGT